MVHQSKAVVRPSDSNMHFYDAKNKKAGFKNTGKKPGKYWVGNLKNNKIN